MCVILHCKTARPTIEVLNHCERANGHGGGVAWLEGGKVTYRKGLTAAEIFALVPNLPLPFVIHFRQASVGEKSKLLCHPFVVNRFATTKETGTADRVLFHNGHWSEWRNWCLNYALQSRGRVPFGSWSDTRGLAWAIYHKGEGMLNLVPGKYCIVARTGVRQYGEGWTEDNGIFYSNTTWKPYVSASATPASQVAEQRQWAYYGGE